MCRVLCSLMIIVVVAQQAQAYKPEDKAVRDLVAQGVAYLKAENDEKYGFGKDALVAYALLKAGETEHPKVRKAIDECLDHTKTGKLVMSSGHVTYEASVALILLASADGGHQRDVKIYLDALLDRQLKNGAWTYSTDDNQKGDTSQTQYALLAMWSAQAVGVEVPPRSVDRALAWYTRTQDIGGGFAYQPVDPGNGQRQKQGLVPHSLVAGALGSMYIGADINKMPLHPKPRTKRGDTGVQGITKKGAKKDVKAEASRSSINLNVLKQSLGAGNGWLQKNYTIAAPKQSYYYLYGLERYMSFRELAEHRKDEEPRWYNEGVDYLKREMKKESTGGSWTTKVGGSSTPVDTSFALLFLLRASGKSIQEALGSGITIGGDRLPDNLEDLTQNADGTIKMSSAEATLNDVLGSIDDTEKLDDLPRVPKLSDKGGERERQIAQMVKLISGENYKARLLAVRTLGRSRDYDKVPALIYALTDPDKQIVREARDGLRFISRKFNGVGIPNDPTPEQLERGITAWKAWYLSIRPNADVDFLP